MARKVTGGPRFVRGCDRKQLDAVCIAPSLVMTNASSSQQGDHKLQPNVQCGS